VLVFISEQEAAAQIPNAAGGRCRFINDDVV